ncbi:Uncharacterised protein [Burkholderia pseudomallei]|nr:Uncharacterised protein [Burkholderia pseudomallei]CAJ7292384.1 Uncharacterised protein [Burkholderia pseudomallei]CAJ8984861.1 Uncharacterised protein [Burkholderia pseudomallei]
MGQPHVKQHYIPDFLLKQWVNAQGKLTHFSRRTDGKVFSGRRSSRGAGYEEHLYSLEDGSGAKDTHLERDFFARLVDDPAAPVHAKLLGGKINELSETECAAWSRFLVAQMVRVPSMVRYVRVAGRQLMLSDVDAIELPKEIQLQTGGLTLREYLESEGAWRLDNASTRTLLTIIESRKLNDVFLRAYWATCEARSCKWNFVIGDRPLLYEGQMTDDFLFSLPLSPTMLFFATNQPQTINTIATSGEREFVSTINKDSTSKADIYVYATDSHQLPLIEKYLRQQNEPDSEHLVASLMERLHARGSSAAPNVLAKIPGDNQIS